jgi:hypothetical protein
MGEAAAIVSEAVDLFTGVVGLVATAAAVALIQPILLPCLLVAAVPSAVTAVTMARRVCRDAPADHPPPSHVDAGHADGQPLHRR